MRAISFGWTTPALLAGAKTVTRRAWKPTYAATFHQGDRLWAIDKDYRYGGKRIAVIRLTADPVFETAEGHPRDYAREGFQWFDHHPDQISDALRRAMKMRADEEPSAAFRSFMESPDPMWVVRFAVEEWL